VHRRNRNAGHGDRNGKLEWTGGERDSNADLHLNSQGDEAATKSKSILAAN
jgi:hypothetical protein